MQAGCSSVLWIAPVAAWCLGVGGHSSNSDDGNDGNGNNASSSNSNARGPLPM